MTTAMLEDALSILAVCRDRLIDGANAVFTRNVGRATDELLAMADRATSTEQQQICFDATQFLANRAPQLLQQFHASYVSAFDSVTRGPVAAEGQRFELPSELSLVDDDSLEEDLTLTKLTTRAAYGASQELVALDRRLAALLRSPRLRQEDNPLYPSVLYKSMLDALKRLGIEGKTALTLLQSFERHTAPELPHLYAEINRYLAESGILPNISVQSGQDLHSFRGGGEVDHHGGGGYAQHVSDDGRHAIGGRGGGGYAGASAGAGQDVFAQLLQAIRSLHGPAGPGGHGGGLGGGALGAPAGAPGPSSFSSSQLVQALGNIQRGHVDPGQMPGLGSVEIDPFGGNVLQQIRSTPMANWSHPMDAMTMDIVAMLFDAMFNDPDLPASVRAEIAKLQIPVLKVALLDKQFFSDRRHPARRLLDVIAHSGLGRTAEDEPRYVEKLRAVVNEIVHNFDSDVKIFESQVEDLAGFLKAEEQRAQDKAVGMVDKLETRERKEMAASQVAAEVEIRTSRRNLPHLVADFLTRHWRLVLVESFVLSGESGDAWKESLRLMDELVWSVEPKSSSQERDRLVVSLPAMLKRLREGLDRVGLQGVWDGFFSELIQLHVAALHKDVQPELYPQGARGSARTAPPREPPAAPVEEEPPSVVQDPLGSLDDEDTVEAPEDLEPVPPVAPAAQPDKPGDEYLGLVRKLEVGAWVEFQSERGTRNTLRLNWVSEFRRVFLFTNRQGENAMTLAASSLADHLRKGTARLLSQNPLTDRAVAQVLDKVMPSSSESGGESPPRGFAWE